MKLLFLPVMLALVVPTSGSALASSSEWFEMEGARVRLVTSGAPDVEGRLQGVLDIELKPGWKTYWRDPGDAGVPPTIDVSANPGIAGATLDFPAPQRHDEGDFQWAGYDYSVRLPVTFTFRDPAAPSTIDAYVFLGVCETICVPVQATLKVDPASDPDKVGDALAVAQAFAMVPPPAGPEFGVKVVTETGTKTALLEARFPGTPGSAELFIAADEGYSFSTPKRVEKDGKTFFSVDVTAPTRKATGDGLRYTLVTDAGAVDGLLPYF
nr:protein-disulfide reductase DsbD domain-containing protein [Mesorhizobium sp.]